MIPREKLDQILREAKAARWRLETLARVGKKLGIHRTIRWAGAKVLARELSKGKANPSLICRFLAENDPDRVAVIQAGAPGDKGPLREIRRMTYREINDAIDRLGLALGRRGVGKGVAVMVLVKNRIEFFVIQSALGRIGASVVTASWRSTVSELEYLASHSGARAVFFDADIAPMIEDATKRLSGVPQGNFFSVGGDVAGSRSFDDLIANERGAPEDRSEDAAVVMYTSGTTGKPKGAVRTLQKEALACALAFIEDTPMQLGEVHLTVCPLYHATAFGFSGMAFLLAGTVVVLGDYRPESFLEAVERYRVNSTAMVPTMIHRLVEAGPEAIRARDTSSLRAIFSGGAPLGGQLAIDAMNVLGDKIYNFYGATETGLVTLAKPADLRAAPGTIGRVVGGNDVRFIDEHGRDVAEGEVGELYAKNPMLVTYHRDQDATNKSMLDGYFSVGDLARRDARGLVHIEGRKRDMIISGGVNVYPAEVEAVVESHPSVAEVAVVGLQDREWGERVVAFVVRYAGKEVTEDELKALCRERLSGPKVPRDVVFMEHLPRNPTGKILKRELREATK